MLSGICLKLFKRNLFLKSDDGHAISRQENAVAQKDRAISRQEKMALSTPGRVVLGLPSPSPRVCTGAQADRRTLTSQPKFQIDKTFSFHL